MVWKSLKRYGLQVIALLLCIAAFGTVLPMLISTASTTAVLIGIAAILIVMVVAAVLIENIFNRVKEDNNEPS